MCEICDVDFHAADCAYLALLLANADTLVELFDVMGIKV